MNDLDALVEARNERFGRFAAEPRAAMPEGYCVPLGMRMTRTLVAERLAKLAQSREG